MLPKGTSYIWFLLWTGNVHSLHIQYGYFPNNTYRYCIVPHVLSFSHFLLSKYFCIRSKYLFCNLYGSKILPIDGQMLYGFHLHVITSHSVRVNFFFKYVDHIVLRCQTFPTLLPCTCQAQQICFLNILIWTALKYTADVETSALRKTHQTLQRQRMQSSLRIKNCVIVYRV